MTIVLAHGAGGFEEVLQGLGIAVLVFSMVGGVVMGYLTRLDRGQPRSNGALRDHPPSPRVKASGGAQVSQSLNGHNGSRTALGGRGSDRQKPV